MKLEYDEIGSWSEIKLEIVRKYAAAYSTIMTKQPSIKSHRSARKKNDRDILSGKIAKN